MSSAPRLIEKWLPINEVSIEAVREGGALAGHPPVNQLHVWWARRPLIASRATIAASMLPADADTAQFLSNIGTTTEVVEARRQMDAIKAEGGWSDISFPNERAFKHNPNFLTEDTTKAPIVLDVTAGGGSIPFEAGRLGFHTLANELNPVACLILRATCQWPQQYGYPLLDDYRECAEAFRARVSELLADVYPEEPTADCAGGKCPHPQRYRCAEGCDYPDTCRHPKLGTKDHKTVRAQRYAQTYLWARTASCPGCNVQIPLSPNWRLDKKGTGMRVELQEDRIDLRIVHPHQDCSDCRSKSKACHLADLYPDQHISDGTVTRAIATCPACGTTTPKNYLSQEAQAGRMGHHLYCVIYRDSWRDLTKAGKPKKRETTCRVFAEPADCHFASDTHVAHELARLQPEWDADDILPNEPVPAGNDLRPITYGMSPWRYMFNQRQQLAHGHCVQAFRQCVDADRLDERRRAAWGYVAIALDKMINRNSLLTRWDAGENKVASTFDSHDFGFKWSYSEMAVTCRGLGLDWSIGDIDVSLSDIVRMAGHVEQGLALAGDGAAPKLARPTEVIGGDARDLPLDSGSVDCIVFDPPYEENVCYAELSDFFYVWLKRTAGYVFPHHFADYLTEKDQEAISSPARFKNRATKAKSVKAMALSDYQQKMAEIFGECRRVIKDDENNRGIMTVMFNHKSTAAWDALTIGLIDAGFAITRTWPVKTEAPAALPIKGKAAARTTILLVCRPREENPFPKPWHEVEDSIAQAVREDIRDNLSQADLRPIDLYLSAFGPALRVISEHWGTERETANLERPENQFAVTPTDALQVARQEVSVHRAREISSDWANSPTDPNTKFYILAKDATEHDNLLFDEANLLARAIGVRLEKNDIHIKRIVEFKADKVNLLTAKDRMAGRDIGEGINTRSTLDVVHTAIALTERRNTLDAQQWLTQRMHDPNDGQFRYTLEALINTTKPGHDDYLAQRNLWQALYGTEPGHQPEQQPTLFGH